MITRGHGFSFFSCISSIFVAVPIPPPNNGINIVELFKIMVSFSLLRHVGYKSS